MRTDAYKYVRGVQIHTNTHNDVQMFTNTYECVHVRILTDMQNTKEYVQIGAQDVQLRTYVHKNLKMCTDTHKDLQMRTTIYKPYKCVHMSTNTYEENKNAFKSV